jgi:FxsC-like protein
MSSGAEVITLPATAGLRASYFYLSYAHSPPLAGAPPASPDQWVRTFFDDLTEAVRSLGSARHGIAPGFFDQEIPLGSDWRASLAHALSTAEVFVPLYSPGYFARSWPGREWASFERRMADAGVSNPQERFVPVLWIPLPPGQDEPGLAQAVKLGARQEGYAENGLRAMLRLKPYRDSYAGIVERLAAHIVKLAEKSPVAPSAAPNIDSVQSPFSPAASAGVFAVTVAARDGTAWRPFRDVQELSLAEYAATLAEQLDLAVIITDLNGAGRQPGSDPGVILIDPEFAADEDGERALRQVAGALPPWILPVLVRSHAADPRETELAERVQAVLGLTDIASPAARSARSGVPEAASGIASLERFVALMPSLVAEAERQYLRRGPIYRATGRSGSRPRLRGDTAPDAELDPGDQAGDLGQAQRVKEDPDD